MKLHEMVVKLFKLFIVSVLFGGEFSILRRGIGGFLVGKEDVYEVVNFIDTYLFFFTFHFYGINTSRANTFYSHYEINIFENLPSFIQTRRNESSESV